MNVEHHIAARLATTKEAEALIAGDLQRALERAFREGQLAAPSATNPYAPPKPKPAWHDALAVMARCSNAPEGHREPFIRSEATHDVWIAEAGYGRTENLRDVTPLIEAKVTDAMIDRILDVIDARFDNYPAGIGEELAVAALGLEDA